MSGINSQNGSSSGLDNEHLPAPLIPDLEIVSHLGSGGSSSVYKARQRALDRLVAVKVLHHIKDEASRARFDSEAKLTASINHDNVVRVLQHGVSQDGRAYFILEYLEGESLASRLKRGPLSVEEFRNIFCSVLLALKDLHDRGIVHRDVKPGNIFICTNDDTSVIVKLLDLGIAKNLSDNGAVTVAGTMLGSPAYMSPEQCSGGVVDCRSDLYSLGCSMYESIAGKPLFAGTSAFDTMLKRTLTVRPRTMSLCKISGAPIPLVKCLLRCLNKDPKDRYESAGALLSDLRAALEHVQTFKRAKVAPDLTKLLEKIAMCSSLIVCTGIVCSVGLMSSRANRVKSDTVVKSLQQLPHDAGVLHAEASALLRKGDLDGAETLLFKALECCHNDRDLRDRIVSAQADLHYKKAQVAGSKDDFDLMRTEAKLAIELAKKSVSNEVNDRRLNDAGRAGATLSTALRAFHLLGGKDLVLRELAELEKMDVFKTARGQEAFLIAKLGVFSTFYADDPKTFAASEQLIQLHSRQHGDLSSEVILDKCLLHRLHRKAGHKKQADLLFAQIYSTANDLNVDLILTDRRDVIGILAATFMDVNDQVSRVALLKGHIDAAKEAYNSEPQVLSNIHEWLAESYIVQGKLQLAEGELKQCIKLLGNRPSELKRNLQEQLRIVSLSRQKQESVVSPKSQN